METVPKYAVIIQNIETGVKRKSYRTGKNRQEVWATVEEGLKGGRWTLYAVAKLTRS